MAGANPTFIERYVGRSQSVPASTTTLDIPRDNLISQIQARVVFPSGGSANYVANAEDLAITRVQLVGNGSVLIKDYSWAQLVQNNIFQNQVSNVEKVALAASTAGGYTSSMINLSLVRQDISCVLPSYLYTNMKLSFTWASLATYGGDSGLAYVDVIQRELLVTDSLRALAYYINKETVTSITPSATGFSEVNLTLGNLYRRLLLLTTGGATGTGARDNTVSNIEVVQDGTVYHRQYPDFIILGTMNKLEYHLETRPTGSTMIGFDIDGELNALPDSAPMSSFKVRLNFPSTSNTATATILAQELIKPVKA